MEYADLSEQHLHAHEVYRVQMQAQIYKHEWLESWKIMCI